MWWSRAFIWPGHDSRQSTQMCNARSTEHYITTRDSQCTSPLFNLSLMIKEWYLRSAIISFWKLLTWWMVVCLMDSLQFGALCVIWYMDSIGWNNTELSSWLLYVVLKQLVLQIKRSVLSADQIPYIFHCSQTSFYPLLALFQLYSCLANRSEITSLGCLSSNFAVTCFSLKLHHPT